MKSTVTARTLLAVSASFIALLPSNAYAQAAAPSDADSGGGLEEIVVTAQKRAENVQDVPVAITALSANTLRQMNVTKLADLTSVAVSLSATSALSDAFPSFSLRGISSFDYSQHQQSPVATYVDEVYKGAGLLSALQLYDLERVEVLNGPQGTLYGKNTTGGAIAMYTRQPSLEDGIKGEVLAGVGNYSRFEASGGVNLPIVDDRLAARVAFDVQTADGFVRNRYPGRADLNSTDQWAYRVALKWAATDTLQFLARFANAKSNGTSPGILMADLGSAGPGGLGFGTGYTRAGLGFFENEEDRPENHVTLKNLGASLTTDWEFSDSAKLVSITSFDKGRLSYPYGEGSPFNILEETLRARASAFSQDLRLASTGSQRLSWLVGAFYYRDKVWQSDSLDYYFDFAGDGNGNGQLDCFDDGFTGCTYENEFRQRRESIAFYTHEKLALTDHLNLTAGLRYTHDIIKLDFYRSFGGYFDPASEQAVRRASPIIAAPGIRRRSDNNVSGKIGLDFKLAPDFMVYASYSTGYRGSAFSGAAFFDPAEVTVAPAERVYAMEAGAKSEWFGRKLRANAAVFRYVYKNQQFYDVNDQLLQILTSVDKSSIVGAEVDLTIAPVSSIQLRLGGTYLDTKFKRGSLQGVNLKGNRLLLAPEWMLNAALDWRAIERGDWSVNLHGDTSYRSRVYFDAFNFTDISQPGMWLHNARATISRGDIDLSLWVKNIANKQYVTFKSGTASSFNFNFAQRGRPREYGIELKYSF